MAKPQGSVPDSATNAVRKAEPETDGTEALERAIEAHGDDIASALDQLEDLDGLLTTAILVLASADEAEVEHVTESTANLVAAADGLTTDGAADLAADLGENADDLSETLDTVLDLQRRGHLDDLVAVAAAFAESLSAEEVEELAAMLEESGNELVDALDLVLDLQRDGHLEGLVDLARAFSTLEVEPETVEGLNTVLSAVGDAQDESEPVGLFGALGSLRSRDVRSGLGYLLAILRAQGRRLRE
ncbi:MAG: DUF1641 domain-containing protein [Salinirussus sp.]